MVGQNALACTRRSSKVTTFSQYARPTLPGWLSYARPCPEVRKKCLFWKVLARENIFIGFFPKLNSTYCFAVAAAAPLVSKCGSGG